MALIDEDIFKLKPAQNRTDGYRCLLFRLRALRGRHLDSYSSGSSQGDNMPGWERLEVCVTTVQFQLLGTAVERIKKRKDWTMVERSKDDGEKALRTALLLRRGLEEKEN